MIPAGKTCLAIRGHCGNLTTFLAKTPVLARLHPGFVLAYTWLVSGPTCCPHPPRFFIFRPGHAVFPSGIAASRPGHGIPWAPTGCNAWWFPSGKTPMTRSWRRLTLWPCPWRMPRICSRRSRHTGFIRACFAVNTNRRERARIWIASFCMDIYVCGKCRCASVRVRATRRDPSDCPNNRSPFEHARHPRGFARAS